MRIRTASLVITLFTVAVVSGKKKNKWLKQARVVALKNDYGETKDESIEETGPKKKHRHLHKHHDDHRKVSQKRLKFQKTDAVPYSSPFSRPYNWNMYLDGPYGWGVSKKRRDTNSFYKFKRSLYPHNSDPRYLNQAQVMPNQPAQQTAYFLPAQQPYSYQAPQSRNTMVQVRTENRPQSPSQTLQKKAPAEQQPQERTWVDKMGVKWTTKKVNDYKWGEREPGIVMDEYAGGPFGFDDVKRNQIIRASEPHQWQRRAFIPRPSSKTRPRSWIDKNGVRWTNERVNDYKWGEREPGVTMDEYNGGPYGWKDVKRSSISLPHRVASPWNMYMDKP